MAHDQSIRRDQKGEEQPADKDRAQTVHSVEKEDAASLTDPPTGPSIQKE